MGHTDLSTHWGNWKTYFAELERAKAEAGEVAIEDEPDEVLAKFAPALLTAAPSAAKSLHKRLTDAGWEAFIEVAQLRVGRKFYKGTEKAGELKSEAYEASVWQVRGRRVHQGRMVAAIQSEWLQSHRNGKSLATFQDSFVWSFVTKEKEMLTVWRDVKSWLDILAPTKSKAKKAA